MRPLNGHESQDSKPQDVKGGRSGGCLISAQINLKVTIEKEIFSVQYIPGHFKTYRGRKGQLVVDSIVHGNMTCKRLRGGVKKLAKLICD